MDYLFSWFLVYFYSLFITVISLIPIPASVLHLPFFDKIVHMAMYALLSFLVLNTAIYKKKQHPLLFNFFYVFSLSFIIECIQFFLPWRSFELADLFSNLLGTGAGYLFKINKFSN